MTIDYLRYQSMSKKLCCHTSSISEDFEPAIPTNTGYAVNAQSSHLYPPDVRHAITCYNTVRKSEAIAILNCLRVFRVQVCCCWLCVLDFHARLYQTLFARSQQSSWYISELHAEESVQKSALICLQTLRIHKITTHLALAQGSTLIKVSSSARFGPGPCLTQRQN